MLLHRFSGFRRFNGFRGFYAPCCDPATTVEESAPPEWFRGFKKCTVPGAVIQGLAKSVACNGFGAQTPLAGTGTPDAPGAPVAGARSHTELTVWKLANELKLEVYRLIRIGPAKRDFEFCGQLRRSSSSAPRNIAEGFGRYLPDDFSRYLRIANGELKETYDALQDGQDRDYFTPDDVLRLQRLSKRASKAATGLIAYLRTSNPPNEPPRRRRRGTF